MRHPFEDSFNMNIYTELKNKSKNYFYKDLELKKGRILLSYITWLLPLKFECANYVFPISSISFTSAFKIRRSNKNAEAVKFLEILLKKSFPRTKKEIFCKRKKSFFHKKTFLQDTNYSCASIFIIHTFISYILTHYSSALNRSSFPETLLCYVLNAVINVMHFFLSK